MPTSATGNNARPGGAPSGRSAAHGFTLLRRSAEHGFTLVELMIVIAILGLATAIVVLTMPETRGTVRAEAEGFAARVLAARDNAIVESRDMAVWVTGAGYGVARWRRGEWQPVTARPFAPVRWRAGTRALVGSSGQQRLVFDTTGAAEPQTVTLARAAGQVTITVSGDGAIRVGR